MKTLKKTLVALAALTIASMSISTVAFATEGEAETNPAAESTTVDPSATTAAADTTEDPSATTAAADTTEDPSATTTAADTTEDPSATTTAPATTDTETTTAAASETTEDADKSDPSSSMKITVETVTVEPGATSASVAVKVTGNKGFAGTGLKFAYDSKLTFDSVKGDLVGSPVKANGTNLVAITSAGSENITSDGTLYTLTFTLPSDAKAGDEFDINVSVKGFSDEAGKDVAVAATGGKIIVANATTEAPTAAPTVKPTEKATEKATATPVQKEGSSAPTGEALPIAGAVAAVAVIGGVAIASKKRK